MLFSHTNNIDIPNNLSLQIGNDTINRQNVVTFLGLYVDSKLDWHEHTKYVTNKLNSSIYATRKIKHLVYRNHMLTLHYSLVYPYLVDYGVSNAKLTHKLKTAKKKAVRIIMGEKCNAHATPIFQKLKILRFED